MGWLCSVFEIAKKLWEVTGDWVLCIIQINTNMQKLRQKMKDLSNQEDDVIAELSTAEMMPGKRRRREVDGWLAKVQKIGRHVRILEQKVAADENDICSRALLGKDIVETIKNVEGLQQSGRFSKDFLVIDASPTRLFIPTESLFGETTCVRSKDKVWEHLMNDEVRRIGVYGMGGAGKTTILYHINNELLQATDSFDDVIWVTVSKAFKIQKVQDEIAKALKFYFSNDADETKRACELLEMLSLRKRYVLILDDLWEAFASHKVGIPEPTSRNGCKLVLSTRSLEVCRQMGCEPVKAELLTEQEALDLFMSKAIDQETKLADEVKEIASDVAKQCGGLPLAVVTVARSMRARDVNDIREWRNALNELISSTKQMRDGETDVLEVLKFSYCGLKDEKLQKCFLYCALYPEDFDIPRKELIDYWISEGLITDMSNREAMFNKGHTILNKLVNACCLLNSTKWYTRECVSMHDLIRDMALKITETSPRFMVHAGERLKSVPFEDWSEDLERVSLMRNEIEILSFTEPLNCPRLTTLLLNKNPLSVIPNSFFKRMPHLTLLDLSYTFIEFLPDSISDLESLHGLFLIFCRDLKCVPSLEKLKALKQLRMWGCNIEVAPQGIKELGNLRFLDFGMNKNLRTLPSLKSSKLSQLQYLRLTHTKTTVAAEDLLWLGHLKEVDAHFENVQEFLSYVKSEQFQNLEAYYFSVGSFTRRDIEPLFTIGGKVVVFRGSPFGSGVDTLVLPNNIKSLYIDECDCHVLKSLSDIPSLRDATNLIHCYLYRCGGLESIISCSLSEDCRIPLKSVEMLWLRALPNLRVLFDGGVIPPQSISFNLKKLILEECSRIKNVFPVAKLLQNFPNLVELRVSRCDNVEDIIGGGEEEEVTEMSDSGGHNRQNDSNSIILLPNLKRITLGFLPKLKSMCKGKMICNSLESTIEVEKCPMLRRLPNFSVHVDSEQASSSAVAPPPALPSISGEIGCCESLIRLCHLSRRLPNFSVRVDSEQASSSSSAALPIIRGEREWWKSLIWDDPQYKSTLKPLFRSLDPLPPPPLPPPPFAVR